MCDTDYMDGWESRSFSRMYLNGVAVVGSIDLQIDPGLYELVLYSYNIKRSDNSATDSFLELRVDDLPKRGTSDAQLSLNAHYIYKFSYGKVYLNNQLNFTLYDLRNVRTYITGNQAVSVLLHLHFKFRKISI